MSRVTIFFPTRNRPAMVERVLKNVRQHCPEEIVYVANCSSKNQIQQTSDIIKQYEKEVKVKEFIYEQDPGCAIVYNDLFQSVETEFAIVWADDMMFLRSYDHLYDVFLDFNMNLVALPMIDDISRAPSVKNSWPKDEHGCALWETPTGRCAHHSIVRVSYFQKHEVVYTVEEYIDNFFHNHTLFHMRYWPKDGAYVLHSRFDDETRQNMLIKGDVFRYPVGHPGRGKYKFKTLKERENDNE